MARLLDLRNVYLLSAFAALVLTGPGARAQSPRLTFGPIVSYTDVSPIYDHTTVQSTELGTATETERLTVSGATTIGARVVLRLAGPWLISAEAARGGTRYTHFYRGTGGLGAYEERYRWGRGSVTTLGLRVGRGIELPAGGMSIDVSLGGGLQRVAVRGYPPCQPPAPSLGVVTSFPCGSEAWHGTYDVPSASGGLQLSRRLGGRLRVHAGGVYTVGRANTSAFWRDFIPQYDHLEAPRSHTVRVTQLSAGLGVGL